MYIDATMEVSAEKEANNSAICSVESSVEHNHDNSLTIAAGAEHIEKNGNKLVACEEKLADNQDSAGAEHTKCPDVTMTSEEPKPTESSKCEPNVDSKISVIQDEYSYIKRDEFTSEIFKVEIQNLPRFGFSVSLVFLLLFILIQSLDCGHDGASL